MNRYKYELVKKAGVEYGFKGLKGSKKDILKYIDSQNNGDDYLDDSSNPNVRVKSDWKDYGLALPGKAVASALYESGNEDIQNIMNGEGKKYFKEFLPLVGPYSDEADGSNFISNRDSAAKISKMLSSASSKLPPSNFDNNRYRDLSENLSRKSKELQSVKNKNRSLAVNIENKLNDNVNTIRETKNSLDSTPFYRPIKKMKIKNKVKQLTNQKYDLVNEREKVLSSGTEDIVSQINQYQADTKNLGNPDDRAIIEAYKRSIDKSLLDNNNYYEWGWY